MRKKISMLLVVVMLLSTMVGCGEKEKKVSTDEKITLTVGIPQSANVTSYDDNALTKYLEEALNLELKFKYFSSTGTEYVQQLSLTATANQELPDVILGFWDMDHYTMNTFGEDGYFIDLTQLMEDYAPNYQAAVAKLSEADQKRITTKGVNTRNGAQYGMPLMIDSFIDNLQGLLYINQTWLDKLGLQPPKNAEELYNVCKAFATQDPNGNGKQDEIPLLGKANNNYDIISYLINPFVYYDFANTWNVTDGKVWEPAVTEEYRQALIYMNKLCSENLLSDMCFTLTTVADYKALITPADNVAKVGIWTGHPSIYTNSNSEILDQYVALDYMDASTDKGGYDVIRPKELKYGSFITSSCKYPERAMQLLDIFYLDETVTRARHGEKDVDWVYEEQTSAYGFKNYTSIKNGQAFFSGNSTWCLNPLGILTNYNYIGNVLQKEGVEAERMRLSTQSYELMQNAKVPTETVSALIYDEEEYNIRSSYAAAYSSYIQEARSLFITGKYNPSSDKDWNDYLSTLKKLHAEELLDVAQSAYTRQQQQENK